MILPMLIGLNKINSISNTQAYNHRALMSISKNETMFPAGEWEMCLVSTIDKKIKPVPMTRRGGDINMVGHDLSSRSVELLLLNIGMIWLCLDACCRIYYLVPRQSLIYLLIVYLLPLAAILSVIKSDR